MYIIKIGIPFSENFKVIGYTNSKKDAENYLKIMLGYNHYNENCHYYEIKINGQDNGNWARIEFINNLIEN
jgi:hypothetical protein